MKGRTWGEIVASRNDYETKAQSHLEYLINNGITVYAGKYGEEIDLNKYFEDQMSIYEKYANDKDDYSLDDLFKSEYKLKKIKEELDGYINAGLREDNNIPQYFVKAYAEMRVLEEQVRKNKISVEKQEKVQSVFGDFTTIKGKDKRGNNIYKSSQEMTAEKNERLAILNDLYQNKQMDGSEFLNIVNAIVDCYNVKIKQMLDAEVKESAKVEPKSVKTLFKKVKNFFHIGKPVANVEDQDLLDAKKMINGNNALETLFEASRLTRGTEPKFLNEAIDAFHEIPVVRNMAVEELYNEIFEVRRKLVLKSHNSEDVIVSIMSDEMKKHQCALSPLKIVGGQYVVKSKKDLFYEQMRTTNFILKKYEHTQNFVFGENGSSVNYKFKDQKAQELYDEVQKVFNTLNEQRANCELAQQQRLEKSEEIARRLEQGATV